MSAVAIPVIPVIRASDPESVRLSDVALEELRAIGFSTSHRHIIADPDTGRERIAIVLSVEEGEEDSVDRFTEYATRWLARHELVDRLRVGFLVDRR